MNLKKLGITLYLVLALGVVMASSAFGEAIPEAATWRTGSGGTVLTGSETVNSTGSGELVTHVGGTLLALKATGVECKGCKIENSGGNAVGSGVLNLTGVTVVKPSTCAVEGGHIETEVIDFTHYYMGGGWWFTVIKPLSGTVFTTVHLVKGSGACAISGFYTVEGRVFTRANNATGVYAVSQTATSSGAINAEGGGELLFGEESAELNGTATFSLSGAKKGQVFGAQH
jgi:hypothetical protein